MRGHMGVPMFFCLFIYSVHMLFAHVFCICCFPIVSSYVYFRCVFHMCVNIVCIYVVVMCVFNMGVHDVFCYGLSL